MLPGDSLSLSQIAPTAPTRAVAPVADPRQQAFQRALSGQVGQSMQANVLARLADGSYVVSVNDLAARMQLPAGAEPGTQVPLTLISLTPRPTFQVQTGQGGATFAEAGPPLADGAALQSAPLALLEGKDAAALMRTATLLAGTRSLAALPGGGAGNANTSISRAGQLLGDVIAAAQTARTQGGAAIGRTPLLGAPGGDAGALATALQQGLDKSGLFYESHVAEWAAGTRARADLAAEPQARGMGAPTDPDTAQLINLQLNAQEQGRVAWQGQLWPGQDLHWEIQRDAPQRRGGKPGDAAGDEAGTWQSSLRLRFGGLGEVAAQVVLSGNQLHIRLDTADAAAGTRLDAHRARLAAALDAAGVPLSTLAIQSAAQGPDDRA